jgi:uncharacterized protein YjbJ (UPF0337 family)
MNRDRCAGMWKQLTGKLKEHWGKLTNDPFITFTGIRDQLAGRIQEQYGVSEEESERQLQDFIERNRYWYLSNR